jgi:hypothetical protein
MMFIVNELKGISIYDLEKLSSMKTINHPYLKTESEKIFRINEERFY